MDVEKAVRDLAKAVALQGDALGYETAQGAVLMCAVAALVQTHPDPSAFAAAFRRGWQLLGSQHSNEAAEGAAKEGFDDALGLLEGACKVPLGVRPPGVAEGPGSQ